MQEKKCLVRFRTHATVVHQHRDGHIVCFKYNHNQTHCELESFVSPELAGEYIIKPMPEFAYQVDVDD